MKNDQTFLKFAQGFITIIMVVSGLVLLIATVLLPFGLTHIDFTKEAVLSLNEIGISPLSYVLDFAEASIILFILFCVRQFFKNIIAEQIFVAQNVKLANTIALSLFIVAFLGEGIFTINGYSFFNVTFIITSLVVWTIGKVLERANEIAEENEFTI